MEEQFRTEIIEGRKFNRRIIGPVPPRGPDGRMLIAPILGKRLKTNALGEPIRGKDGQPIEEVFDTRHTQEYLSYAKGLVPLPEAIAGLDLYEVSVGIEPALRVYGRTPEEAASVFKKELGIQKIGGDNELVVRRVNKEVA